MKVVYIGSGKAGCIGLATLLAVGCKVIGIIAHDDMVERFARKLIPSSALEREDVLIFRTINSWLGKIELIVSVQSKETIPANLLRHTRYGEVKVQVP